MSDVIYAHVRNGKVVDLSVHDHENDVDAHMANVADVDFWFQVNPNQPFGIGDKVKRDKNKSVVMVAQTIDIETLRKQKRDAVLHQLNLDIRVEVPSVPGFDCSDQSLQKLDHAINGFVLDRDGMPRKMMLTIDSCRVELQKRRAELLEQAFDKIEKIATADEATIQSL